MSALSAVVGLQARNARDVAALESHNGEIIQSLLVATLSCKDPGRADLISDQEVAARKEKDSFRGAGIVAAAPVAADILRRNPYPSCSAALRALSILSS